MVTNLPPRVIDDSAAATKLFFDKYGETPLEFPANDVSAAVGFFTAAGFDNDAALVTSMTLLKQAKLDSIPIYQILDTIKGFNELEISQLVGEILNNNRVPTSTLGFRTTNVIPNQSRNIAA